MLTDDKLELTLETRTNRKNAEKNFKYTIKSHFLTKGYLCVLHFGKHWKL
jgi:hypothetical protein